jgi:PAS domain S-box-containing protein
MVKDTDKCIEFLLKNISNPVIVFNSKNLKIIELNKEAELFLNAGKERDMREIFNPELLQGIQEDKLLISPDSILKNGMPLNGEVHLSQYNENKILIIKTSSDRKLNQIISGIKHPIAFFNDDGKLVFWNDKAAFMFGFTSREVIGKSVSDLLKLLNPEIEGSHLFKSFREGLNKFKTKSGKELIIETSNSLIKERDGTVSGVLSLMRDISDMENQDKYLPAVKRREDTDHSELQLSESRFRMLFEQSPLIIQIFNSEGDLVKYNSCFKTTWDIKQDMLHSYNIFKDEKLAASDFNIYIEKAIKGEFSEISPLKYSPQYSDHYIWMRGFMYPVMNFDNCIREIVLILENITDQKKIEESFGIEASYRNAIESSISAGIAVVDFNGKQTYVNEAFCRMVGWSKEELTGLYPPFPYWSEEGKSDIESALAETIKGEAPTSGFELKFKKKNNEVFDVLVIINPLKTVDGKIQGWLASVSDISKLKSVEKEIKHSLREKEVLLKEIHHRVKNNLQIISSLLNLQLNYIQDKEMQMIFKESQNRVMSMALIHQKLYLSKNQLSINLQEYINELIQHLMKSYNIGKDIEVDVQVNNVYLDNDKVVILGLIVNELISNALQYAFTSGKRGNIQVHMNNTGSGILLMVKDDGKGFPDNINYRKTHSLGLQLVNTLVDQLGGNIKLKQNNGTEFDIRFSSKRRYS